MHWDLFCQSVRAIIKAFADCVMPLSKPLQAAWFQDLIEEFVMPLKMFFDSRDKTT
jgi:hypothetical protein